MFCMEIADELLHSLDAARREKWTETIENLNFQTSIRQAWALSRKLGIGAPTRRQNTTVSPSAVASHIVVTSRAPKDKEHTAEVKREAQATETEQSRPYTREEVSNDLKDVKSGKAPGFDDIHPEFLIN
ncbi:hypothetical protein JTB14_000097 [Gonioctena quinquepunctata]|nr:hypothetical protein JTB14_000097 [Gonioctena quinquepunctata]